MLLPSYTFVQRKQDIIQISLNFTNSNDSGPQRYMTTTGKSKRGKRETTPWYTGDLSKGQVHGGNPCVCRGPTVVICGLSTVQEEVGSRSPMLLKGQLHTGQSCFDCLVSPRTYQSPLHKKRKRPIKRASWLFWVPYCFQDHRPFSSGSLAFLWSWLI